LLDVEPVGRVLFRFSGDRSRADDVVEENDLAKNQDRFGFSIRDPGLP